MTDPPAPSTTTAAVIGPSDPAESAPSRCSPSAAVPAIATIAQLTEAMADSTASPQGMCPVPPSPLPRTSLAMQAPPIRAEMPELTCSLMIRTHSWALTTLRARFTRVNGAYRAASRHGLSPARLSDRGLLLK